MAIDSPKNDFAEKHRWLTYADEPDTVYDGSKIMDDSITTDKLADYAVTTDKIDDESITLSKMDTDVLNLLEGNVKGFDTVADMQAATLEAGDICHTNGFHAAGDGGAAFYKVVASGTANGMDVLACGDVFANLVITESYVTPEMFGAYGDGVADDSAFVIKAAEYQTVKFCKTYNLAKNIGTVLNQHWFGNGTICISNQETALEFSITFGGVFSLVGLTFQKLLNTINGNIAFINSNNSLIEGCKFICDQKLCNGFPDVYSNNVNLKINGCYFYIDTTLNNAVNPGCVNIREQGGGNSENITVTNCVFKNKSSDEIVSVRVGDNGGHCKNVTFGNCIFEHLTNNTATYSIAQKNVENVKYSNCTIIKNAITATGNHYVFGEVEGSIGFLTDNNYLASFDNCKFILLAPVTAFAYTASDYVPRAIVNDSIVIADSFCPAGARFVGCNIKIANNITSAGACIYIDNSKVLFANNNTGTLSNANFEMRNSELVIENTDDSNKLMYQPVNNTHFIVENCRISIPHSLGYGGGSTAGTTPIVRVANNVIKAVKGTFGTPANSLVDSYITNNIWDSFTPSIPNVYRVSNNVRI